MKLILAIIHNDDSAVATSHLTENGYFVTRLSTTGGFLQVGNTTLLIGTSDDKVPHVREILRKCCGPHTQVVPTTASLGRGIKDNEIPDAVQSGGASIFVLSVDSFEKL